MRRGAALVLALTLALPCSAQGAEGTQFTDVAAGDWFAPYVEVCAERGLMEGTGEGRFEPEKALSAEECSVLALRLYDLLRGGDGTFEKAPEAWGYLTLAIGDGQRYSGYSGDANVWGWVVTGPEDPGHLFLCPADTKTLERFQALAPHTPAVLTAEGVAYPGSVTYQRVVTEQAYYLSFFPEEESPELTALLRGLVNHAPAPDQWYRDAWYTAQGWELDPLLSSGGEDTRLGFAWKLAAVAQLEAINSIAALPDTDDPGVLALYSAGILTGTDEYGTFNGYLGLTRAEAAAMLARVLDPELRLTFTPQALPQRAYSLTPADLRGWEVMDRDNGAAAGWLPVVWREADGRTLGAAIYRADGTILELGGGYPYSGEGPGAVGDTGFAILRRYDPALDDEQWGVLDVETGEMASPYGDCSSYWEAVEQCSPAAPLTPGQDGESGLWGYVDASGSWAVPARYARANSYQDGWAVAELGGADSSGDTYTVLDADGQEAFSRRYLLMRNLGDGVFFYRTQAPASSGLVDSRGVERPSDRFLSYTGDMGLYANAGLIPYQGQYYNDHAVPVTPQFEWAGPVGDDGAGFVGMDGTVYRIQFK